MMPTSWGLKGEAFAIAEAHYYYEGEELERELARIKHGDDAQAFAKMMLQIDHRYKKLTDYSFDLKMAELEHLNVDELMLRKVDIDLMHNKITDLEAAQNKARILHPPGVELEIALLEVDHKFNRISRHEFEKQRASLRDEPWIAIINSGFDAEKGIDGVFFEFDWNSKWVEFLKLNGYIGHTEDQIIDDWFSDVCRSHTAAELAGSLAPTHHLHRD